MWGRRPKPVSATTAPRPRRARAGSRGVALVIVLLIVALLTAIVARLSFSNQLWTQQVANSGDLLQSVHASRAVQEWARLILQDENPDYDGYGDLWAMPLLPMPAGRGFVQGRMEDMQARFNLNNLVNEDGEVNDAAREQFTRLLRLLDLSPGIAAAAIDWIDPDGDPSGPWGAEDGHYLALNPPYLAANQPFVDPAELRLARGVDGAAWEKLRPHVAALPRAGVSVNVNTAGPVVLAAMIPAWGGPQASLGHAKSWTDKVRRQPFRAIGDFYQQAGLTGSQRPAGLDVKSEFFTARVQVSAGRARPRLATLYRRAGASVAIVRHKREME